MTDLEKLQQWLLYTPSGRYTLTNERIFYHNLVQNVFGYYSLQIGLPQINFLQGNKIPHHYIVNQDIKSNLHFLPFASNSIDLIVCPHSLEFTPNYHSLLEECYRILIPEGKLILTSFSRGYAFNAFKRKSGILNSTNSIKLEILKQQLAILNFRIGSGKFFCYRPIIDNAKLLAKLNWLDKVGDRWFPTQAHNFGLTAIKEVVTPTRIMPATPRYIPEFTPNLGTAPICKHN